MHYDSPMLKFAEAIEAAIELPEDEVVDEFGIDKNRSKADSELAAAYMTVQYSFPEPQLATLRQELERANAMIQNLQNTVLMLENRCQQFAAEQERFMKACVCVTLNREPNPPAEG